MISATPQPRKPAPLPYAMLVERKSLEPDWERNEVVSVEDLARAQEWALSKLTNLFIAESLGGTTEDDDFSARVDEVYDTLRDSMTRQDLIVGFLFNIYQEARAKADKQLEEFQKDLSKITSR